MTRRYFASIKEKMSIVSSTIIKTYLGMSTDDYTNFGTYIHNAIEAFIKNYCGQPFESTVFTNKLYDGSGGRILRLDEKPIISVKYIALSIDDVIKIKHTLTDASLASVVVDSTNITLTVEGGAGNSSNALAKATYTTCTLLVAAINALSGWSAEIYDSDYNALKTAYMQDQQLECAQDEGVSQDWQYLSLAHNFASGFVINKDMGEVYYPGGFSDGFKNICITYTAGYTTVPSDVTFFILDTVKFFWNRKSNDAENISNWRVGDLAMTYSELKTAGVLNSDITAMLDQHKNVRI